MTVDELLIILDNLGIPERSYSINANLKSDIHVLRKISDVGNIFMWMNVVDRIMTIDFLKPKMRQADIY